MTTPHEADIINAERQHIADRITKMLQRLDVEVGIEHFSGDSSYPVEHQIAYQGIQAVGPTFEMALLEWIEKLIEVSRQPASTYQTMEKALNALAHGLSALRADVLDIKARFPKTLPEEKTCCTIIGVSTQMAGSEHARKTYLMTLHDGDEKDIQFNLQVHADGRIVAEPRPAHELDYDDLDHEEDDYDDDDDDDSYFIAEEDDEDEDEEEGTNP